MFLILLAYKFQKVSIPEAKEDRVELSKKLHKYNMALAMHTEGDYPSTMTARHTVQISVKTRYLCTHSTYNMRTCGLEVMYIPDAYTLHVRVHVRIRTCNI